MFCSDNNLFTFGCDGMLHSKRCNVCQDNCQATLGWLIFSLLQQENSFTGGQQTIIKNTFNERFSLLLETPCVQWNLNAEINKTTWQLTKFTSHLMEMADTMSTTIYLILVERTNIFVTSIPSFRYFDHITSFQDYPPITLACIIMYHTRHMVCTHAPSGNTGIHAISANCHTHGNMHVCMINLSPLLSTGTHQ